MCMAAKFYNQIEKQKRTQLCPRKPLKVPEHNKRSESVMGSVETQ